MSERLASAGVKAPRLLLFDIDGTLMDTGGAGLAALLDAAEFCLNVPRNQLPALDLAGATDGAVVRSLFEAAGHELSSANIDAYHEAYLGRLAEGLNLPGFSGRLLPGVETLLQALTELPGVHLGLLTGNIRKGAMLKLQRFAIDSFFLDGAFGDDAEDRNKLGPVAVQRLSAMIQRPVDVGETIIIGDTPKDIACANALGARCIAVATGRFAEEELAEYRPWQVLPDVSDTGRLVQLLTE